LHIAYLLDVEKVPQWGHRFHCLGFFPRSWEFGGQLGIWGFCRAI